MSENICYTDAYARATDATVVEVDADANAVLLDRTVFYPGGGGQPADTGLLTGDSGGSWRVIGAKKRGEEIWHTIEVDSELPALDTQVIAELDWHRRHDLMRTHSALHVLCGVVWRDHQASVTGGNMEPLSGRMDFEFETMSGDLVGAIEKRVNLEIEADREIQVAILPREEALAIRADDGVQLRGASTGLRADRLGVVARLPGMSPRACVWFNFPRRMPESRSPVRLGRQAPGGATGSVSLTSRL